MLFIQYPKCTTCRKAYNYLKDNNVNFEDRNIVEDVPTKEELIKWINNSNLDLKKFFNTSGKLYRELNLKDKVKDMDIEEAAKLLSINGMLIKRPLLISDDKVIVGFKEDNYRELL